MPELPEVETVRSDLGAVAVNRRIESASTSGKALRRPYPDRLGPRLQGRTVSSTRRWGKHLLIDLEAETDHGVPDPLATGEVVVIHLGMSGQLWWQDPAEPYLAHTHLVISFGDAELRLVDPRTFGWVGLGPRAALASALEVFGRLGPDALSRELTGQVFAQMLARTNARLKLVLMDQAFVAGIGNIYADEILHAAGLRWDRRGASLARSEVEALYSAMREVLRDACDARGSTLADAQYRDLFGRPGSYQAHHRVHARQGLPCPRCGAGIVRERIGGRSTYFCPSCQH